MADDKAIEAAARAVAELGGFKSHTFPNSIAKAAITAYLAQREADGFVMVPVEPTEAMLTRGKRQPNDLREVYRAMIAARAALSEPMP